MGSMNGQRWKLLKQLNAVLEGPLIFLGFVWLVLLVVDLIWGSSRFLNILSTVIWVVFIVDFLVKFIIAPNKVNFVKSNVVTVISLIVPAFRMLRIFRLVRFVRLSRGARLVKILGSLNRGIRSLSRTMERRALGYILLLTLILIFAGAAGMYAFEKDQPGGLEDYGSALWWTTMIMTTLGSQYWPATLEGRILCVVLSVFAFAIFGYITATIATFFVGQDAEDKKAALAGRSDIDELKQEIRALRKSVEALKNTNTKGNDLRNENVGE